MIVTSKKSWCYQSENEIFDSLRDLVLTCDLKYSKDDALDKVARAYNLWCGADYVTAVRLLDENEPYFKKSDWPYFAIGVEILKARKHEFFSE